MEQKTKKMSVGVRFDGKSQNMCRFGSFFRRTVRSFKGCVLVVGGIRMKIYDTEAYDHFYQTQYHYCDSELKSLCLHQLAVCPRKALPEKDKTINQ